MIFQDPMSALNPVMRIGDQLEEALDAHLRLSPADKRARILGARDVRLPDPEGIAASYPDACPAASASASRSPAR